jgi:hypothetical protein
VKVGYFSAINQLFLLNSEFKTSASHCCANQILNIAFISFIQTGLSEAVLYFVGAIARRHRHFLYSGD